MSGGRKAARAAEQKLERVAEELLTMLRARGVEHAEVAAGSGRELEVGVRNQAVELVKEAGSHGVSVRAVRDGRVAVSSTSDLQPETLERFADSLVEMTTLGEEDPLAAPPEPKELAKKWTDIDMFDPRTSRVTAERAIALATRGEKAAFRADKRITASEGASFSRSVHHTVLATSGGFVGARSGTYQSLVVQAIADDEGGKKRNGFDWTGGRFLEDLATPTHVGREAAKRAVAFLGARKMETGTYPVVFDKDAARGLVGLVASCVVGDAVYRQRSFLAKRLGDTIASSRVTLVDDPLLERGPGSRPFDGEGRRARKNVVVRNGVLQTFLLDTYSARKLKLKPTGSASGGGGIPHSSTSNFYLRAGRSTPESLLKGVKDGLYVVRMMGFGFDAATGNFSRGAEGFRIRDGELAEPVGEITVSRNLGEILTGIDRVADDLEFRTTIASPSFRVDAMTIAGE